MPDGRSGVASSVRTATSVSQHEFMSLIVFALRPLPRPDKRPLAMMRGKRMSDGVIVGSGQTYAISSGQTDTNDTFDSGGMIELASGYTARGNYV